MARAKTRAASGGVERRSEVVICSAKVCQRVRKADDTVRWEARKLYAITLLGAVVT